MALLAALPGCKAVQDFIHDDEVIAKVGDKKLFLSQLAGVIPNGISPEDSTNLALQYITTWAKDQIFLDVAEAQLSKEELDVTQELADLFAEISVRAAIRERKAGHLGYG